MPWFRRTAMAVLMSLALPACSSGSSGSGDPTSERVAFSYSTNLIPVQISVAGQTGTAYVDTGNPFTLLDPATFTSVATLSSAGGNIASIVIGNETAESPYVIATSDGVTSPDPGFPTAANLGCSGICQFVAAFNYRDVSFAVGTTAPPSPSGLEPESVLDFSLGGGSQVDGVTLPPSRIVVTVSLEGNDYSMIVDTGASAITVSQRAYSALTTDGRAQLSGGTVETTSGVSTSSLTRAASVVVSGVEVSSVVVAHDSSFDTNLTAISADVGSTIDGSLGGTYLHEFFITVDYPAKKLHLARYTDTDFAIDPAERIGIALAQMTASGPYIVTSTSASAASKGVAAGDVVVSIDGFDLASLQESQIVVLAFGKVGATKMVGFGTAATNANKTVPILVEEFLPLPAGM